MDKEIKKVKSKTKSLLKDEGKLMKADKKRDAMVEKGKMAKKKGC